MSYFRKYTFVKYLVFDKNSLDLIREWIKYGVFIIKLYETGLDFFKLLPEERYPNLRDLGLTLGSMLGSTYICESSFSNIKFINSKYRCSLSDKSLTQLLRLYEQQILKLILMHYLVKTKILKFPTNFFVIWYFLNKFK